MPDLVTSIIALVLYYSHKESLNGAVNEETKMAPSLRSTKIEPSSYFTQVYKHLWG